MHFDLSDMVEEFGSTVGVVRLEKSYYDDDSNWVEGEETIFEIKAILSNNTDDTMTYYDSGSLHSDFYKIYTNIPLERDDKIVHDNLVYTLFDHRDYDTLAVPHIYFLKRRDKNEVGY